MTLVEERKQLGGCWHGGEEWGLVLVWALLLARSPLAEQSSQPLPSWRHGWNTARQKVLWSTVFCLLKNHANVCILLHSIGTPGSWATFVSCGPRVSHTPVWGGGCLPAPALPPRDFPAGSVVKNPLANAGDTGNVSLILQSGRSPGIGNSNSNLLQYSCLENPMDRGGWWATVHGVTKESGTTDWACTTARCLSVDIPFQHHRSKMLEGVVSTFAAIIMPFCTVSTRTPLGLILREWIYWTGFP